MTMLCFVSLLCLAVCFLAAVVLFVLFACLCMCFLLVSVFLSVETVFLVGSPFGRFLTCCSLDILLLIILLENLKGNNSP